MDCSLLNHAGSGSSISDSLQLVNSAEYDGTGLVAYWYGMCDQHRASWLISGGGDRQVIMVYRSTSIL